MTEELKAIRQALDTVDRRIVECLAERDRIVERVAALKTDPNQPLRDIGREEMLLTKIVQLADARGLSGDYAKRLFQEILDHSVRRQHRKLSPTAGLDSLRVAFQGTEGSYSHGAAAQHFASADAKIELLGHHTFRQAFDAVVGGAADYGVLPVENTTAGSINETYDLLAKHDLAIVGEEVKRIDHCVLALQAVPLSKIRRILSQAQALAQCTEFLDTLEHCQAVSFTDTALSCQKIVEEQDLSQAAIASADAARVYGLKILKRGVANQKDNFTRFAVIAKKAAAQDMRIPCKTSLILATRHEKGALLSCMTTLSAHALNLTKLESRPRPGVPFEYLFYVDFEGNVADPAVQEALRDLRGHTSFLKIFGSYPSRTTEGAKHAEPKTRGSKAPASTSPDLQQFEQPRFALSGRSARSADSQFRVGTCTVGPQTVLAAQGPAAYEQDAWVGAAEAAITAGAQLMRMRCFLGRRAPNAPGASAAEAAARVCETAGLSLVVEVERATDLPAATAHAAALSVPGYAVEDASLLDAIGQSNCPVFLERPSDATDERWLAAVERVLESGNQQVILLETGVRALGGTGSALDIRAIPALRSQTHLPVFADLSSVPAPLLSRVVPALAALGVQGVFADLKLDPSAWASLV